jgi:hypothetical protein
VLVSQEGIRPALPVVEISKWARPAYQIQKVVQEAWALSTIVLEFLPCDADRAPCAVLEVLAPEISQDLEAVHLEQFGDEQLSDIERASIHETLACGANLHPFSRLGWIDKVVEWVEGTCGLKIPSKAGVEQFNAGGSFALLRFPTADGGCYWFKATGAPNSHELAVTQALCRTCGEYLPKIAAVHEDWNAWITREDGSRIAEFPKEPEGLFPVLEMLVVSIAGLQIATLGHEQELLDAGAFDQRIEHLYRDCDPLFEFLDEAMRNQTSTKVAPLGANRLGELRSIFKRTCECAEALGIPDTVVHGDLNSGNILWSEGGCRFIDWSEAYVGFPCSSLEHLLLLNKIEDRAARDAVNHRLRERYRASWSKLCDPKRFDRALAFAPILGIASTLYARGDWLNSPLRFRSERQAYARTLARYMDREARDPEIQ